MVEASVWMMALGLTGIISAGVIVAAKVGEWIGDMFDDDEPQEPDDGLTIEERTRRAA